MQHRVQIDGHLVDLNAIDGKTISIEAVASTLSRNCRFNGALRGDWPVQWHSVADHCRLVAALLYRETEDPSLALVGLLHDAHESLIGDIPTPVKHWFGIGAEEKALEMRVLSALGVAQHLSPRVLAKVKAADVEALRIEVNALGLDSVLFGFDPVEQCASRDRHRALCDDLGILRAHDSRSMSAVFRESAAEFLKMHSALVQQQMDAVALSEIDIASA